MKLNDLLKEVFAYGPLTYDNGYSDYSLMNPYLKLYKDRILQTDEFKDVESLEILDTPVSVIDGKFISVFSYLPNNSTRFSGKCMLYQLSLRPFPIKAADVTESFLEGGSISPIIYDVKDLTPCKIIGLKFKPYSMDLENGLEPENIRSSLHKLLDSILDEPKKYEVQQKRDLHIRGVFEFVKSDNTPKSLKEVFDFKEEIIL